MARPYDDPELHELARRYVMPNRRYMKLGGALLRLNDAERARFAEEIGRVAAEITPQELSVLLEGSWRERKTAAWLIAVSRREEFRSRIGELLVAGEGPYAGGAYCTVLASFSTAADAGLLVSYLDRYLRRPDLGYDQGLAMGALLHLDHALGSEYAGRFLVPDGLWWQWLAGPPAKTCEPDAYRPLIEQWCAFAAAAAQAGILRRSTRRLPG